MEQLATVTNRETWDQTIEVTDADTGDLVDMSGWTDIKVDVRHPRTEARVLNASLTASTITVDSVGYFSWKFSRAQMAALEPAQYEVGITFIANDDEPQLFRGVVSVLDGIMSR